MRPLIVFLFFYLISNPVHPDDFITTILDKNTNKKNHLYLKNAHNIKELDTVTYYFTNSKPNEVLFDSFKQFSIDIGKKNGAVYIPLTNNALKVLKNHKQDGIYKYSKASNCDFSYVTSGSILFEIRDLALKQADRCIIFPIKDNPLWLASLLKKISYNIKILKNNYNINTLKKNSIIAILMNGVDANIDNKILERNKPAIRNFMGWLSHLFKNKA